ncbi:glycosyltransferase [Aequorivita lipolytica]|nr:glycosyltransferase [Aequorivita lipolytica]
MRLRNNLPLLSVIVRTLGSDIELLRKALSSVFKNSYSNIEVVIVFQGIDKALFEAVKNDINLQWPNKAVHFIQNKTINDERSKNLNMGLEAARGEYFAFLDDDDYVAPTHYENLISAISREKTSMAFCLAQVVDENDKIKAELFDGRFIDKLSFYKDNFITIHSFVVTGNAIERLNLKFDERLQLAEDYLFLLPLYMNEAVSFVPERTSFYRIVSEESQSFTSYENSGKRAQQYELLKNLKRRYKPSFFQKLNLKIRRLRGLVYKVEEE